jgi:hypothetical protein
MKTSLFRLSGKALLILAATSWATPKLVAQDDVGVRFGIKLAPNMSWIKADTKGLENNGSTIGFTFGLITEFPIGASGNYRFGTGLFLNNTGGKYLRTVEYLDVVNGPILKKDLSTDFKTGFIELPLTFKLMTNEIGYMRYYGQLGFGASYNIRAKADFDSPVFDTSGVYVVRFDKLEDEDFQNSIQPFRASLIVGAGLEYNFSGSTTLQAGVTYNNGFTNALKNVNVGDKKAKGLQNYLELNLAVFF